MNICIIPARGGSRRIPMKNIRDFHGKPIIAYSIQCAKASGIFDHVVVSTDDPRIAKEAMAYGALVHARSPEMAIDSVGTQDVMREVISDLIWQDFDLKSGYACCLYATAPMLQPKTLVEAFKALDATGMDYIVPVATWLTDPGQFYFGNTSAFMKRLGLIGETTILLQIDPCTACDINTEEDWGRAFQMYAQLHDGEKQ